MSIAAHVTRTLHAYRPENRSLRDDGTAWVSEDGNTWRRVAAGLTRKDLTEIAVELRELDRPGMPAQLPVLAEDLPGDEFVLVETEDRAGAGDEVKIEKIEKVQADEPSDVDQEDPTDGSGCECGAGPGEPHDDECPAAAGEDWDDEDDEDEWDDEDEDEEDEEVP